MSDSSDKNRLHSPEIEGTVFSTVYAALKAYFGNRQI